MPVGGLRRKHFAPARGTDDLDREADFLRYLAMQRLGHGLAEFDAPAGQGMQALAGWPSAAHQQNFAVAKDRGADGELGSLERRGRNLGHQSMIPTRRAARAQSGNRLSEANF
jgi:hypothetical protein